MSDYHAEIETAARAHGLDAALVEAVVMTESAGQTDAFRYEPIFYRRYLQAKPEWAKYPPRRVSSSYGLMQVMYPVAVELGFRGEPELLFVPSLGLHYGCAKLADCLAWAKGDVTSALAAYNGGKAGNVPGDGVPDRNEAYAQKVLAKLA